MTTLSATEAKAIYVKALDELENQRHRTIQCKLQWQAAIRREKEAS